LPSANEFNPAAVWQLTKFIKQNRIDIVHVHTPHAHSHALQAKFLFPCFKLIVHRRVDFPIKRNPLSLYKYRTIKVDKIIAISGFIRSLLERQGIPAGKIELIYDGIDTGRFTATAPAAVVALRRRYGLTDGAVVLGNVAALTGHKGHMTLVRSMQLLAARGIAFKLFILGEGEKRTTIEREIQALGLSERIILTGFQDDVGPFLSLFDILVHSSRDEGLGTAILDGLACGLPVVSTNAGGIPEILGADKFGLVVPKQDPPALADGIARMLNDTALREKFKRSGPDRAKAFDVDTMVKKTYVLYQNTLKHS
jgi:glycosyltransferase involved in cell wall biosynthesis